MYVMIEKKEVRDRDKAHGRNQEGCEGKEKIEKKFESNIREIQDKKKGRYNSELMRSILHI
jgi:hypothetical protein